MGAGNVVVNAVWKLAVVVVYAGLYELTPLRMPADEWWTYVLLFFADDFAYYWFHRIHHEVRVFWASHVVHHSSQHYNLSTALRQTWTPMTALPFWAALALLGFQPWMILTQQAISLIYAGARRSAARDPRLRWERNRGTGGTSATTLVKGSLSRRRQSGRVKLLFVPFAIVAFVLFLLLLGAIGLVVSMAVLAFFGQALAAR